MHINDTSAVSRQQGVADDAHVTRQTDQLHTYRFELRNDFPFVIGLRRELFRREDEHLDPMTGSPLDHRSIGLVADQQHDLGIQHTLLASRDDGFEVRTATAGKDRKTVHRLTDCHPGVSVIRPMTEARSPAAVNKSMARCASEASNAMTIPIPMLKMLNISRCGTLPYFSKKRKTGRISHDPSSISIPCPSWRIRGMFSSKPPPVMWLIPCTSQLRITSNTVSRRSSSGSTAPHPTIYATARDRNAARPNRCRR